MSTATLVEVLLIADILPGFGPVKVPNRADRRDRYRHPLGSGHRVPQSTDPTPAGRRRAYRATLRGLVTLGCAKVRAGRERYGWLDRETIRSVARYSGGLAWIVASLPAIGAAGTAGAAEDAERESLHALTHAPARDRVIRQATTELPRAVPVRGPSGTATGRFAPRRT